tara:strand:- start:100 stop:714 length:615 start_codon:yes stop_codon:yes gene_type:complete
MSYFITDITAAVPTTGAYGSNGKPSGIDNDQGNIRAGGTISESTKFSANSLGEGNPITTIVSGVNNFQAGLGTWNQQSQFSNIVKATTTIGGVSNNALVFGASDSAQGDSIHQAAVVRNRLYKTAVRAGNWNEYTGTWSSDPTVANTGGYDIANGVDLSPTLKASGVDHAANPSSARPGELTAFSASGTPNAPTNLDYKPRYLW